MLARLAVAAVLVLVASASGALADGRVALVIGNDGRRTTPPTWRPRWGGWGSR